MNPENLLQRLDLGEDQDVEFKLAEGGLPKSLWETISAFANTEGGTVVLGVAEQGEKQEIVGVRSPAKLIKAFWDGHNNSQKFSPAVCTEGDQDLAGLADHVIAIPAAEPLLAPLLAVIPLQLFAYHVARLRECPIDQPRNLAKSVTVE